MRNSTYTAVLLALSALLPGLPPCADHRNGITYIAESDVLVSGGTYLWSRSQQAEDTRTLYVESLGGNARTVLHRSEGALSELEAAPRGVLVAAIERIWEENFDKERATYVDRRVDRESRIVESYYFEDSRLLILNLAGAVVHRVSGVRRFAWDLSGQRVAYITGTYYEGGLGFKTTGTWIVDLSSNQTKQIHAGGVDVQWAGWDGNVYIDDPVDAQAKTHVLQFDPDTEQLTPSSHHGIYFSPDGRYYYDPGLDGGAVRLFQTATDSELEIDLSIPSADRPRTALHADGWIGESALVVPSPVSKAGDYVYEIPTGTLRHAGGSIISTDRPAGGTLVLQGTTVVERTLGQFTVIR